MLFAIKTALTFYRSSGYATPENEIHPRGRVEGARITELRQPQKYFVGERGKGVNYKNDENDIVYTYVLQNPNFAFRIFDHRNVVQRLQPLTTDKDAEARYLVDYLKTKQDFGNIKLDFASAVHSMLPINYRRPVVIKDRPFFGYCEKSTFKNYYISDWPLNFHLHGLVLTLVTLGTFGYLLHLKNNEYIAFIFKDMYVRQKVLNEYLDKILMCRDLREKDSEGILGRTELVEDLFERKRFYKNDERYDPIEDADTDDDDEKYKEHYLEYDEDEDWLADEGIYEDYIYEEYDDVVNDTDEGDSSKIGIDKTCETQNEDKNKKQ